MARATERFFDALVDDLADSASPIRPHRLLSLLYEDLLSRRPALVDGTITLVHDAGRRKQYGLYYTPEGVAQAVVSLSLQAAGQMTLPRVLDPAMGTGVFLLEAVRQLARQTGADPASIAERCIFGVDRDPLAVRLTIGSLSLETGARSAILARHLVAGDALRGELPEGQFDLVVGNPPWGARYDRAEQKDLRARFSDAVRHSFDSFKLFLHLASARTEGALGMVLPQAMLCQTTHADIRAVLLDRLAPYAALDLGNAFPGAAAPACALIFASQPGPPTIRAAGDTISAHHWTAAGFPLVPNTLLTLLRRLQGAHPLLGDLSHLFRVRDSGLNYNRASLARRALYTGPRQDPRDLPRYRGRNFHRYTPIAPDGWLRHDAGASLQPGEDISFDRTLASLTDKIVFRQTADRIVATLDDAGMVMGRSVIAIIREADVSLPALLAVLNSRLLTLLYRTLAGEEGRILPQVKVARMLALPVPAVAATRTDPGLQTEARQAVAGILEGDEIGEMRPELIWASLDHLGERLLAAEGQDQEAEVLVDRLVICLYGLTEEEVLVICPTTRSPGIPARSG